MKNKEENKLIKVIEKGYRFLEQECENGFYKCYISDSRTMNNNLRLSPREIGSSLFVLECALKDRPNSEVTKMIIRQCNNLIHKNHLNFYEDTSLLPDDIETTTYGFSALLELNEINIAFVKKSINEIINNTNENGIMQVYFKPESMGKENRIDHVSIADALYLVNLIGREKDVKKSEDYIFEVLRSRKYLQGSRYYHSPDTFLYFLSRLIRFSNIKKRFYDILAGELQKRIGTSDFPLDLAMRVTISKQLGITNNVEKEKLIELQNKDGSWPADALDHYGSKKGYFGSKIISTAFAVEALK